MTTMCGKRLKYLRNGFTMLEMSYEFEKFLKSVGNDVYICSKWLKCLRKGQKIWEMTQICGKCLKYV